MPHRDQKIFDQGWMAWTDGARFCDNPYPLGSMLYASWLDGWNSAEEDYEEQERQRVYDQEYGQ